MTGSTFEHQEIQHVARQLCVAAGENPDRTVRFSAPMSADQENEPVVTRQIFVPSWKLRVREATRLVRAGYVGPTRQDVGESKLRKRNLLPLRMEVLVQAIRVWANRAVGILRQTGKKQERTFQKTLLDDDNKRMLLPWEHGSMEANPRVLVG